MNTPHKVDEIHLFCIIELSSCQDVVSLIKTDPMLTTLLVASEEVDQWHRDNGATYSFEKCDPFIVDGVGNTNANHHVPPYVSFFFDDGYGIVSMVFFR